MLEAVDHWEVARRCELFRVMPEHIAREFVAGRRPIVLDKGQVLFQRGDPADAFFVVLAGWIKLARTAPDGAEVVVHVVKAGETFAEAAMFLERAYPVNAEAATEATVLRIDANAMRTRMVAEPSLAFAMLGSMSLRLRGLVDEIERLKGRRALARLAGFLLEFCDDDGERSRTIELPFEKILIAARLGITPESLSRALAKLGDIGVEVAKGRVSISDHAALVRLAEGDSD